MFKSSFITKSNPERSCCLAVSGLAALMVTLPGAVAQASLFVVTTDSGIHSPVMPVRSVAVLTWSASTVESFQFGLPRFAPELGTLDAVYVGFYGVADSRFDGALAIPIVSTGSPAGINANIDLKLKLSGPGLGASGISSDTFFNGGTTLASRGQWQVQIDPAAQTFDTGLVLVPATALSQYQGAGTVNFTLSATFAQEATISPAQLWASQFQASYELNTVLVYSYTAVPEPGEWSVLSGGTLLLAGIVLHRRRLHRETANRSSIAV